MPATLEQLNVLITSFQKTKDQTVRKECHSILQELLKNFREGNEILNFSGINLSGLDLSCLDLSGCDFSDAEGLEKIDFSRSNLRSANFRGNDRVRLKILRNCNFDDSICNEADFSATDLRGCNFSNAQVIDIKLSKARLDRNTLVCFLPYAKAIPGQNPQLSLQSISLQNADLRGINFSDCYLFDIYFADANLSGTKFGNADVLGCNFRRAKNLDLASLRSCANSENCILSSGQENKKRNADRALKGTPSITSFFGQSQDQNLSDETQFFKRMRS